MQVCFSQGEKGMAGVPGTLGKPGEKVMMLIIQIWRILF